MVRQDQLSIIYYSLFRQRADAPANLAAAEPSRVRPETVSLALSSGRVYRRFLIFTRAVKWNFAARHASREAAAK